MDLHLHAAYRARVGSFGGSARGSGENIKSNCFLTHVVAFLIIIVKTVDQLLERFHEGEVLTLRLVPRQLGHLLKYNLNEGACMDERRVNLKTGPVQLENKKKSSGHSWQMQSGSQ